jgi:hypothetical protein
MRSKKGRERERRRREKERESSVCSVSFALVLPLARSLSLTSRALSPALSFLTLLDLFSLRQRDRLRAKPPATPRYTNKFTRQEGPPRPVELVAGVPGAAGHKHRTTKQQVILMATSPKKNIMTKNHTPTLGDRTRRRILLRIPLDN